jgi:hypothetical protein
MLKCVRVLPAIALFEGWAGRRWRAAGQRAEDMEHSKAPVLGPSLIVTPPMARVPSRQAVMGCCWRTLLACIATYAQREGRSRSKRGCTRRSSATWQQAPAAVQGSNSTAHGQTAGSDQTAGGWREMHASTAAEEGSGRPGPDAPLIQLLRYSMTHNTLHHPTTPSITLTPVESPTSFHGQI